MGLVPRNVLRVILILSIAFTSAVITRNTNAAGPSIVVTAVWHPGTQLSTIDANNNHITDPGDDLRYADLELDVTTNVQFWAMELTCTVNKAALETYTQNSDPNGTGDDTPVVTWGPGWFGSNSGAEIQEPFNATTGAMTIAAANSVMFPLGLNMVTTSFPLAKIRYRVKPTTAATTSTLSCTGSFLNTDGKIVLAPTFVMPAALKIIPGYTLSGNVSYQGRTAKSGIGVQCITGPGPTTFNTMTDASGNFTIKTRIQGTFQCYYYGNTSVHPAQFPDIYLQGTTRIPLNILSYKLLPVTLYAGNLDQTGLSKTRVDIQDITRVTSNYGVTTTLGDVNGDGKTDKADLALVAGNLNLQEVYDLSHIVYGFTDGLVTNGSRIWTAEGATQGIFSKITQQIPGTNVDNWPALSPDGTKLVVTRRLGNGPNYRYALFIMNSDGTGAATQITPTTGANGNYDAFAASWSPDGSMIAFDCATIPANANDSWMVDSSNLCAVDSAGHGFRVLAYNVRIFPPAWLDNSNMLFALNEGSCCSVLEKANVNNPGSAQSYDAQDSTSYIDDPIVSNGALFYRYMDPFIGFRMADLDANGNVASAYPTASAPYHVGVSQYGEYMSVKLGGRDVVYGGADGMTYESFTYNGNGTWSFGSNWIIRDAVGNPAWNATANSSSYFYALRNTHIWVP